MSEFYVISTEGGDLRVINFRLDRLWFELVSQNLGIIRRYVNEV